MRIKALFLVATTLFALVLGGCEEASELVDKEAQELQRTVDNREAELLPLAGTYRGTMQRKGRPQPKPISLVLLPTTVIVQNPGRNDITQFPTLGGTLNLLTQMPTGEEDALPIAHYSSATYDARKGSLKLSGTFSTTSAGPIQVSLDATVQGGHLTGTAHSSLRGLIGNVDLNRVVESAQQ